MVCRMTKGNLYSFSVELVYNIMRWFHFLSVGAWIVRAVQAINRRFGPRITEGMSWLAPTLIHTKPDDLLSQENLSQMYP